MNQLAAPLHARTADRPRRLRHVNARAALILLDAAAAACAWPILLHCAHAGIAGWRIGIGRALIFILADLISIDALGLYHRDVIFDTERSLARLPVAIALGVGVAWLATALLGDALRETLHEGNLLAAALLGFYFAGMLARVLFAALKHRAMFRRRLLVLGAGARAWDLAWMLRHEGASPNYDFFFVQDDALGVPDPRVRAEHGGRVLQARTGGLLRLARRIAADCIVIAPDERRGMELEGLIQCKTAGFPVLHYLAFLEREIRRVDIKRIELGWLVYSDGFRFGPLDSLLKRALDITVSAMILAAMSPVLLAAAFAIKLGDGGPILYRQPRVTRNGRVFSICKLRTMGVDAEVAGAVWAASADPRVTRVGRVLRNTRIDELPQLVNVLSGAMSLVGPRPERPGFVAQLADALPLYHERHMVKAGLTGWAQINYPYGASIDDARSKLSFDLYYVKNFSVLFDIRIILQTLRVVLWPSGAR